MKCGAAVVLAIALAVPACAQHGFSGRGGSAPMGSVSHTGSMGHSGFSGQSSSPRYSGQASIQRPSRFSPPGGFSLAGHLQPPMRNGARLPYRGYAPSGGGHPYRPAPPNRYPHRDPYHDHDHDHHGGHHHWYVTSYGYGYYPVYGYPYYPYPYVINPGFYDWSVPDYSDDQQGANSNFYPQQSPGYTGEPPNPEDGSAHYPPQQETYTPPPTPAAPVQRQEYHFAAPNSASAASPPLTVIFKGGRASLKMQNYMVNSSTFTDLDSGHFEKIPLEQIDIAATEQINARNGIDFQVPIPSRD